MYICNVFEVLNFKDGEDILQCICKCSLVNGLDFKIVVMPFWN